jgi:arginine utilization regulatory protein
MSESASDAFRWQGFFQHAAQPMFLVNRRRRVLFVNRAWEACTGLKLAEVRGRSCRRRSAAALEKEDAILSVCAPPADALAGRLCQARRRAHASADWWEIQFVPIAGADGLLGILGIIRVLPAPGEAPAALPDKLMALRDRQAARYRLDDLGIQSPAIARLQEQARLAAQTRLPITLLGEAGAGKEWLARAIHCLGAGRQRYFTCLDAERLPPSILGEVLFGPGRRIGFGTVYLREPALLPREWQSRLAESVKPQELSDFPRLIVGFRSDPRLEIQAGRLLEEFYCAISPISITIPPLRERLAELPHFIDALLQRQRELTPHSVRGIGGEAMQALRAQPWPRNLRELNEVLLDACRRARGERIELADLPFYLKQGALPAERRLPLDTLLEQVERRLIALALKLTQNNQTRAAELLEIWRPRLLRRMEKFGLPEGDTN